MSLKAIKFRVYGLGFRVFLFYVFANAGVEKLCPNSSFLNPKPTIAPKGCHSKIYALNPQDLDVRSVFSSGSGLLRLSGDVITITLP